MSRHENKHVAIDSIVKRLRKEPFNCSTRDILDMSPAMIRSLLCTSDDEEDKQMAKKLPRLPSLPSKGKQPRKPPSR